MASSAGPDRSSVLTRLRTVPRGLLLRLALLVVAAAAGVALLRWPPVAQHMTQENLMAVFDRFGRTWWAPIALLAAYALAGPLGLPVSPLVVTGGAVFGVVMGSLYNGAGLFFGSLLTYFLARFLGREAVAHIAGKRLRRVERAFERRGFWPLVQIRFMPLPMSVVNYGAALAGVRLPTFVVTSAIGFLPVTLMHTYFAARAARASEAARPGVLVVWGVVWFVLAVVTGLPAARDAMRRKRRYRMLKAARAARRA